MSQDFRFLVVDGIIFLVLLIYLLTGRKQGIVRKLSGLAATIFAILGGKILKANFSALVSERWLRSIVEQLLEHARASIGAEDIVGKLGDVLSESKLPDFLKTGVLDKVAERISGSLDSAVGEASVVIADRVSELLVFVVGAMLIYIIVKLLFNTLIQPLIDGIGILKAVDHLLGAVAGLLIGVVVVGIVLLLAYKLVPSLSADGGPLSAAVIEGSYLTKIYFHALPNLFTR